MYNILIYYLLFVKKFNYLWIGLMLKQKLTLSLFSDLFAVCRLEDGASVPDWLLLADFYSVTKTKDECSVICLQELIPSKVTMIEKDWRMFKIQGVLDFALIGVLSSILLPLAQAQISILALSTFNTDYILVKNFHITRAIESLRNAGFEINIL